MHVNIMDLINGSQSFLAQKSFNHLVPTHLSVSSPHLCFSQGDLLPASTFPCTFRSLCCCSCVASATDAFSTTPGPHVQIPAQILSPLGSLFGFSVLQKEANLSFLGIPIVTYLQPCFWEQSLPLSVNITIIGVFFSSL